MLQCSQGSGKVREQASLSTFRAHEGHRWTQWGCRQEKLANILLLRWEFHSLDKTKCDFPHFTQICWRALWRQLGQVLLSEGTNMRTKAVQVPDITENSCSLQRTARKPGQAVAEEWAGARADDVGSSKNIHPCQEAFPGLRHRMLCACTRVDVFLSYTWQHWGNNLSSTCYWICALKWRGMTQYRCNGGAWGVLRKPMVFKFHP